MHKYNKIISLVQLIWIKKKHINFKSPPKNNFLIVDDISIDYLKKTILNDLEFCSISTKINLKNIERNHQKETYYLSFKIILYFIYGRFKKLNYRSSYIFSCIKCSSPKLVLNNCHDWNLIKIAKEFPNIKFVMLCHGSWFDFTEEGEKLYKQNNMTTMPIEMSKTTIKEKIDNFYMIVNGKKDIELFEKIGVNKNINKIKFLSFGSCEASYNQSLKLLENKKYDFLFISQEVDSIFKTPTNFDKIFTDQTRIALQLLSRYALEKNLLLAYLCRSKSVGINEEIRFAKEILNNGCDYEIIKNQNNPLWSSIYSSKIITTIDSTSGYDSISIKKKTMLFPLFFSDKSYYASNPNRKLEDIWKWTITNDNYQKFENLMDELINLEKEEYEDQIKETVNYLFDDTMKVPSHKSVYNFIKSNIA